MKGEKKKKDDLIPDLSDHRASRAETELRNCLEEKGSSFSMM